MPQDPKERSRRDAQEKETASEGDLAASITEWQTAFDAIEYSILVLNQDGRVRELNEAARALSKKSRAEIIGQTLELIGSSQPWLKMAELVSNIQQTGSKYSCQVQDESQGIVWGITANPIIGRDGGVERAVVVARNVTQKRQSELMTIAESLIVRVAHQVRNPLFGISSALDVLEALLGDHREYQEHFAVLRREVFSLSELMQELLEYSKPPIYEFSLSTIEEVIGQALRSCAPLAEQLEVKFDARVQHGMAPIFVDEKRLAQAFINLLENAVQHSCADRTVIIEAKETSIGRQPWIECTIKDSGPGFPPEDLSRVFEPFFTRRRGGTGLGLPIAQRIIEAHGGTIRCGNRVEGGAVVSLMIRSITTDQMR